MANYHHGVLTQRLDAGIRPARVNNVSVVGLLGTAPLHHVAVADHTLDEPIIITNREQGARFFGPHRVGYTIPSAIDAIFDQIEVGGACEIIVINVLDIDSPQETTNVVDAIVIFEGDVLRLPRQSTNIDLRDETGVTSYTEVDDYTYDAVSGVVTRTQTGLIAPNQTCMISYDFPSGGHKTSVVGEQNTFIASGTQIDTIQLNEGLSGVSVADVGGSPIYVEDTDYIVDYPNGVITRLRTGSILENQTVQIDYTYVDPSIVQNSDIIGEVTPGGDRTGLKAFKDSYSLYGKFPKMIIVPVYSALESIAIEIEVTADDLDCFGLLDVPAGTSYLEVIAGRGPNGNINIQTNSTNMAAYWPWLVVEDPEIGTTVLDPPSARMAGIWCNIISQRGYWWSPSNIQINGVKGAELVIEHIPGRSDTEANLVNAAGVNTFVSTFGAALPKCWGNHSLAWPTRTHPDQFLAVHLTQKVVDETMRLLCEQYVDRPITDALIDAIVDSGNRFLQSLVRQGGLIAGTGDDITRMYYDKDDNPPEEIALGHLVFRTDIMPPPPAQKITIKSFLNVDILNGLNVGRSTVV